MNALTVIAPLAALWILLVWAGTRHVRQREEANRLSVERHLRSVGPMPERWIDLREREGRE